MIMAFEGLPRESSLYQCNISSVQTKMQVFMLEGSSYICICDGSGDRFSPQQVQGSAP